MGKNSAVFLTRQDVDRRLNEIDYNLIYRPHAAKPHPTYIIRLHRPGTAGIDGEVEGITKDIIGKGRSKIVAAREALKKLDELLQK